MKRNWTSLILFIFGLSFVSCAQQKESITLWPHIEAYEIGYLKVSDIHELYYELSGNPDGKPVFGLHGGPGGSCSPEMRQYFNPDVFRIILHDQRGAGQSRPFAETNENTTWHLVEDIETLRKHVNADKIILFGGSWGSTLALAYAETYPEHVAGMVLRGIFTSTQAEINHFYHGGVRPYYPEVYDRFVNALPDPNRRPLPAYLLELMQEGSQEDRAKYARVWAEYEIKIAELSFPDEEMAPIFETFDPLAFAMLENYYMANHCFFEEGQLFDNADRMKDIPLIMVNGRYDLICPPITAYKLHQKLPKSKLVIAEEAGHWMADKPVQQALLNAMREFE
ncbi:prolyl aminopeptidase [candidate division KSB1 bacterium]|nr:prolyl aminopeptidase [candidate division KSB1 bacterium]